MIKDGKIGGFSLFALWFGAAVSLAEIMTGSLIAPLGILKGTAVIVIGHLIGCMILAFVGIIGFKEKKPSLVSSRMSLGRYGSYIISVFNILQLIGWTAIMLIQCSRSLQPITSEFLGINSFAILTVFAGVLVAVWALSTDKGITVINNVAVVLLAGLSIFMIFAVVKGGQTAIITESISFGAALELSIIMPLSWVPLISDYTMSGKSAKGSFFGSYIGYFAGSTFMYMIGLITAVYTGASDPIGVLLKLNMGYYAFFIVLLATVTTTFLDVYSAVLTTRNLFPEMSKKKLIVIYTALGTALALYFPMEQYQNFLYMIGSLFAPVFTVIITDYFIYKKDRSESLINLSGFISAAAGTASYYIINGYEFAFGATIPSMVITFIVYFIMHSIEKKIRVGDDNYVEQN